MKKESIWKAEQLRRDLENWCEAHNSNAARELVIEIISCFKNRKKPYEVENNSIDWSESQYPWKLTNFKTKNTSAISLWYSFAKNLWGFKLNTKKSLITLNCTNCLVIWDAALRGAVLRKREALAFMFSVRRNKLLCRDLIEWALLFIVLSDINP